jgi:hypothetical protein
MSPVTPLTTYSKLPSLLRLHKAEPSSNSLLNQLEIRNFYSQFWFPQLSLLTPHRTLSAQRHNRFPPGWWRVHTNRVWFVDFCFSSPFLCTFLWGTWSHIRAICPSRPRRNNWFDFYIWLPACTICRQTWRGGHVLPQLVASAVWLYTAESGVQALASETSLRFCLSPKYIFVSVCFFLISPYYIWWYLYLALSL